MLSQRLNNVVMGNSMALCNLVGMILIFRVKPTNKIRIIIMEIKVVIIVLVTAKDPILKIPSGGNSGAGIGTLIQPGSENSTPNVCNNLLPTGPPANVKIIRANRTTAIRIKTGKEHPRTLFFGTLSPFPLVFAIIVF